MKIRFKIKIIQQFKNNTAVVPVAQKIAKKYHHIKHDHTYTCYLCGETFEMQSFVTHFRAQHPKDSLKCEFCASLFESSNGLFKHEYSHLYMKCKCDVCSRLFQFPYELKIHSVQHTRLSRHQYSQCTRTFGSKCSRVFHERSLNVWIKCDLCPMCSKKIYNNQVAVNQHKRGMYGPGWTTACRQNYKWKSHYSRHNKSDCKKGIQKKALKKWISLIFCIKWTSLKNPTSSVFTMKGTLPSKHHKIPFIVNTIRMCQSDYYVLL